MPKTKERMEKQMQKMNEKQNANPVGANCIRPHFEGMTQNKGITLIALIITIIVMLILVGVTVNVALNGGLFTKAEYATKQTQIEAEKEELLSAVVAAIGNDGKVVMKDIKTPTGWSKMKEKEGTYTSPKGNTYTVDENGKITEGSKGTDGFYGYEYYMSTGIDEETGEECFVSHYLLDNGLLIQRNPHPDAENLYIYLAYEYILDGTVISIPLLEQQAILSDDYKTFTFDNMVFTRNENKTFKSDATLNTEYNIYFNAVYCSSDAKYNLCTAEFFNSKIEMAIYDTEQNEYSVEEFLAMDGIEVSQNGKQIVYNGITYYLVEE